MKRRGGFVLIAALWLIVALSAVALDAALRSQPPRLAAANRLDDSRAREAALAGTEYARSRLSAALIGRADELRAEVARERLSASAQRSLVTALVADDDTWRDPQQLVPDGMALGDASFRLDLRDTGVRLNINEADEDALRGFLAGGLRIDYREADHLTQAILDWRDDDDLPRINGGEREQYIDEGLAVLPPNRAFADVDELRHVMGMTPELFARVEPYVTVIGSGRINLNAAPEPVLFAVPGFTNAAVATMLQLQSTGAYPRSIAQLRSVLGGVYDVPTGREATELSRSITFGVSEIEIVSEGRVADGPMHAVVRTVVVRSDMGALVLWRRLE